MYEVLSETEFNFINKVSFRPNIFVDISDYLDEKIEIIECHLDHLGTSRTEEKLEADLSNQQTNNEESRSSQHSCRPKKLSKRPRKRIN